MEFAITTNFAADNSVFHRLCDIVWKYDRGSAHRSINLSASFYSAYVRQEQFAAKTAAFITVERKKRTAQSFVYRLKQRISGNRPREVCHLSVGYPIITDEDYAGLLRMRRELQAYAPVLPIIIRNYETHLSPETGQLLQMEEQGQEDLSVTDRFGCVHGFKSIQALGMALEGRDSFCPRGYACDAGIRSIWISATGDVMRCPAIGSDMSLGNIADGSFKLLNDLQVCASDHCSCNTFGSITSPAQNSG